MKHRGAVWKHDVTERRQQHIKCTLTCISRRHKKKGLQTATLSHSTARHGTARHETLKHNRDGSLTSPERIIRLEALRMRHFVTHNCRINLLLHSRNSQSWRSESFIILQYVTENDCTWRGLLAAPVQGQNVPCRFATFEKNNFGLMRREIMVNVKVPRNRAEGSEGVALLSLDLGARRVGRSSPSPGRFPTPGKTRYPLYRRLGRAPGPVWTCAKNLDPTGIRSPDRPARSQSLYPLSYPGPHRGIILRFNFLGYGTMCFWLWTVMF
jgi:hypothetical protein